MWVHPAATSLCTRKWSTVCVISITLWTAEKCVVCWCSCAQWCTFVIVPCLHIIQSHGAVLMQCSFFYLPNAKELYHNYMQYQDSRDSSVGIVIVYGLGNWWHGKEIFLSSKACIPALEALQARIWWFVCGLTDQGFSLCHCLALRPISCGW